MQYEEGLIIGKHCLERCLDRGGEAEVWKAVHRDSPSLVSALKLRPPVKWEDRQSVNTQHEAFKRECNAWIAFAVRSLYVVNILDVVAEDVEIDGVHWVIHGISSEFAELGDLQVAIDDGRLRTYIQNEIQFVQFLSNITSGAAAGLPDQICHCDIKPKNILIFAHGSDLVPKLMDFGVSTRVLEPLRGLTPEYAAPELWDDKKTLASASVAATELSDVYSLGRTFLDILIATLVEPNPKLSARKISKNYGSMMAFLEQDTVQVNGQPDPTIPYRKLISSMLGPNPDDRPRLAEIASVLQSSWRQLLAKVPQHSVKTQADTYLWNPAIHEMLEEKLHYVFIKGGNPSHDLKDIVKGLENVGVEGYSLRSVTGAWDYILRVWASRASSIKDICDALAYNSRTVVALEVASQQLTYARPRQIERIVSEVETLRAIEACATSEAAYEKLRRAGFVGGKLNKSPKSFRVTLLVDVPPNYLRVAQFAGSMIVQEIQKDPKAKEVSSYDVHGVFWSKQFDANVPHIRLIIKFMHTNFLVCRQTLLKAFASVGDVGNDFKFSTLFDMNADRDVLSDDGSIISRIQAACSEKR